MNRRAPAFHPDRRATLRALAASALAAVQAARPVGALARPASDPFTLGVASGAPLPDGFVLWTRLLPADFDPQDLPSQDIPVRWEVAEDDAFRRIVREGEALALADRAHALHLDVRGLTPDRPFWYRFHAGGFDSPTGRARTAPAPDARPRALRFAFASCQHWEHGHFGAYRQLVRDDCDLVLFLGDYLYEHGPHPASVTRARRHPLAPPRTLADWRARHALYRSDPALQAAHAASPWLFAWDDHEVENDYAGLHARDGAPDFPERRALAYRAFFEHMPLRFDALPVDGEARVFGALRWGNLATFHLLDDRQYRDPHACLPPGRRTGELIRRDCPELADPRRTLLGEAQEAWLRGSLAGSGARWDIVAQQTLVGSLANGDRVWPDGWDGYPLARERLLSMLADERVRNPVVIGGDVHGWYVNDLPASFERPGRGGPVATEFCGTSMTSPSGIPQWTADAAWFAKPWLRWTQVDRRGYTLADLRRERMTVRMRAADDVRQPEPEVGTIATFVVEDGRPGARRA